MRRLISTGLFLAAGSLLYGQQLDSNSLTITASRSMNLQPDQIVFAINVDSNLSAGLDDIIAALQGSGITASNLSGVSSAAFVNSGRPAPVPIQPSLRWIFDLSVPYSRMQDTVGVLTKVQTSIAQQKGTGLSMTFNVQGTQVSDQLRQSQQCSIPDLLADARTQAQNVATATGLTVGQVLAMSTGQSPAPAAPIPVFSFFAFGNSTSSVPIATIGLFATGPPQFPATCSLTVKFGLLRFQ